MTSHLSRADTIDHEVDELSSAENNRTSAHAQTLVCIYSEARDQNPWPSHGEVHVHRDILTNSLLVFRRDRPRDLRADVR